MSADTSREARPRVGDELPKVLDAHDIGKVFGVGVKAVYNWAKAGKLRRFELAKPIGSKRWSGKKLQEYLDGEGGPWASLRRSA